MVGYFWNGKSCREGMEGRETITEMNWFEAMRVARQSHFQTKSGWRIPTKAEFEAVVGRHKDCKNNEFEGGKYAASRAIAHPATEKDGHPGIFWSSTPQAGKSVNAWNVNFDNGAVNATFRDAKAHLFGLTASPRTAKLAWNSILSTRKFRTTSGRFSTRLRRSP
ncbi:MAG: DUF1566 domain-containing protein [Rhodoferax sp.]|nr:DUF1566 domain-containing protein [Rhodoferax sp.]